MTVAATETSVPVTWRTGRLDFQDEPLSVVIANVNRYAAHEIVIADPEIGARRFTGTVFADSVEDWMKGTLDLFALRAEPDADGRLLLYAQSQATGATGHFRDKSSDSKP